MQLHRRRLGNRLDPGGNSGATRRLALFPGRDIGDRVDWLWTIDGLAGNRPAVSGPECLFSPANLLDESRSSVGAALARICRRCGDHGPELGDVTISDRFAGYAF